jgi:hypothetical protein
MFFKRDAGLGKLNCEGKRFKAIWRDMDSAFAEYWG